MGACRIDVMSSSIGFYDELPGWQDGYKHPKNHQDKE